MQHQFEDFHRRNITPGPMQTVYLSNAQSLVMSVCEEYVEENGNEAEVNGIFQTNNWRLGLIYDNYRKLWKENIQGMPTTVTVPISHTLLESTEVWAITNFNDGEVVEGSEEVAGDAAGNSVRIQCPKVVDLVD